MRSRPLASRLCEPANLFTRAAHPSHQTFFAAGRGHLSRAVVAPLGSHWHRLRFSHFFTSLNGSGTSRVATCLVSGRPAGTAGERVMRAKLAACYQTPTLSTTMSLGNVTLCTSTSRYFLVN